MLLWSVLNIRSTSLPREIAPTNEFVILFPLLLISLKSWRFFFFLFQKFTMASLSQVNRHRFDAIRPLGFALDVWILFLVEFAERIAYYGCAYMLTSYCVDMLDMSQSNSNYVVNGLYAISPLSSVLSSGLSDGVWGRRKTLLIFGVVYTVGMTIVAVGSFPFMFYDFPYEPSTGATISLIAGMLVFAIGFGGMKVCTSPLEADTVKSTKSDVPLGKLFRWAYWVINFGSLFGLIGAPLLRTVEPRVEMDGSGNKHATGFYYGFAMCAVSMALGILVFACRFRHYPRNRAKASYVMFRILFWAIVIRVKFLVGAIRDPAFQDRLKGFSRGRFLMYASYVNAQAQPLSPLSVPIPPPPPPSVSRRRQDDSGSDDEGALGLQYLQKREQEEEDDHDPNYNMFDEVNVDELSATCHACSVFLPLPLYWLISNQFSTNVILQAAGMNLPTYFPADAFNNINTLTVLIGIAVVDKLIFPMIYGQGGQPSVRLRMLIGFTFATLSMVYCGVLELFLDSRGNFDSAGNYSLNPGEVQLSAMWLIPPFVLQGIASIFVDTTSIEAAYTLASRQFKSSVMSLYLLASSASGFLGIALAPLAVPNRMVAVFMSLAAMQVVVAVLFGLFQGETEEKELDMQGSLTFEPED